MRKLLLIITAGCFIASGCSQQKEEAKPLQEAVQDLYQKELKPFYHGVASGDPYANSVVIWTRVTPDFQMEKISVSWEVSTDKSFTTIMKEGTFETSPSRDYTVKVVVDSLEAGTDYFYRFKALKAESMIGKTKTTPEKTESLNFAVVSCSNYEFGYFNAYGRIADRDELDAVIHLGDYIYEYAPGKYGDTTIGRIHKPAKELIQLQDYRTRYSQYRLDNDLRSMHANHPFIAIWDDHEIANNTYKTGAQNHQEEEGDFTKRKNDAVQAYYEWMPIRESKELYRNFHFGNLADLIMLDERLAGRTKQADSLQDPSLESPDRTMLGKEQLAWFKDQLKSTDAKWKIVGNQVIFSYLNWGHPSFSINLDSWDGYPLEQAEIVDFIKTDSIENIVFVTGDTHSSWAFEVTNDPFNAYDSATAEGSVAVEFGVTSINSGNSNERTSDDTVKAHENKIVNSALNPHLKYANLRDHGYLLVNVTDSIATAKWYYVETLRKPDANERLEKEIKVEAGSTDLELVN